MIKKKLKLRSFFPSVLIRQVRSDGKDKNSVVSFTLTDEPQHIDLQRSNSKDEVRIYWAGLCFYSNYHTFQFMKIWHLSVCVSQAVRLAVVCKDGQLHLFEHFLNGWVCPSCIHRCDLLNSLKQCSKAHVYIFPLSGRVRSHCLQCVPCRSPLWRETHLCLCLCSQQLCVLTDRTWCWRTDITCSLSWRKL